MLLKVDYRETDLLKIMNTHIGNHPNCIIESVNLPLGDIIICDDTGEERLLIERKTLKDLAASIKDGRYVEQSYRLTQCNIHNHNIFYLIEGNIHNYSDYRNITRDTLFSSMTSLIYTKGFSLYRSLDTTESAIWIIQTADKLSRIKEPCYYAKDTITNITPHDNACYNSVSKRVKKNNITPDNISAIMLSQIPNVSTISAQAILREYKTLDHLMIALRKSPDALSNITTSASRKLTKLCIHNIYSFLIV